jgi:hypothetical protein
MDKLDETLQNLYNKAYKQGMIDGREKLSEEIEPILDQLKEDYDNLLSQYKELNMVYGRVLS